MDAVLQLIQVKIKEGLSKIDIYQDYISEQDISFSAFETYYDTAVGIISDSSNIDRDLTLNKHIIEYENIYSINAREVKRYAKLLKDSSHDHSRIQESGLKRRFIESINLCLTALSSKEEIVGVHHKDVLLSWDNKLALFVEHDSNDTANTSDITINTDNLTKGELDEFFKLIEESKENKNTIEAAKENKNEAKVEI